MRKYIIATLIGAFVFWLVGLMAPDAWWILAILFVSFGLMKGTIPGAIFLGIIGLLLGGIITLCDTMLTTLFGPMGLIIIGAIVGIIAMRILKRFF